MRFICLILAFIFISGCQRDNEKKVVALVKYNGKYGFIDTKGDWFIDPHFDSLGIFYNGMADSYQNKKVGKINSKGILSINHRFDFIGHFENERALVILGDSINYIDLKGNLISEKFFFNGEDFSEGLAPVQFEQDGKWAFINISGRIEIDSFFDYAQEFKNNLASVEIGEVEYLINRSGQIVDTLEMEKSKRKYQLIGSANGGTLGKVNNSGDTVMQMKYRSFGYPQGNSMWFFTGEKYGLADTTGKIIIEPIYENLTYFSDNGLALAKKNGFYGYIEKDGKVHINFKCKEAQGFKYGLAAVLVGDKWGFINENGEFVIEPQFQNVLYHFRPVYAKYEPLYDFERD